MVKNPPTVRETWVQLVGWEDPWRRAWQPTSMFLPRESHGQMILVGYGPWGQKESDMTKHISERYIAISPLYRGLGKPYNYNKSSWFNY